jgi:cytochrome b involved in lipid metabolism
MFNGRDATDAFLGRVYRHSNAAMNLIKKYAIARLVVDGQENEHKN